MKKVILYANVRSDDTQQAGVPMTLLEAGDGKSRCWIESSALESFTVDSVPVDSVEDGADKKAANKSRKSDSVPVDSVEGLVS